MNCLLRHLIEVCSNSRVENGGRSSGLDFHLSPPALSTWSRAPFPPQRSCLQLSGAAHGLQRQASSSKKQSGEKKRKGKKGVQTLLLWRHRKGRQKLYRKRQAGGGGLIKNKNQSRDGVGGGGTGGGGVDLSVENKNRNKVGIQFLSLRPCHTAAPYMLCILHGWK